MGDMGDIPGEIDHQYFNNLIKIYDDNLSLVAEDIKCIREEYSHLNGMVTFLTRQLLNHRSPCSSTDSTLAVTDDEDDEPFSGDIENPLVIDDRFVTSRKSKNPENNLHTTKNAENTTKIEENNDFCTFRDSFILIGLELGRLKEKQRKDNLVAQLQKMKNEKHQIFLQHQDDSKIAAAIKESSRIEENRDEQTVLQHVGEWINHSNDFATNTMIKWGYGGGGLGKNEDGIREPIAARTTHFSDCKKIEPPPWPKNTVLIAGSSMINSIDETRMSRKFNVKVRANNGATATDMVDHLNAFLRKKPDHLILHVGSNDVSNNDVTSETLFSRLLRLKSFAEYKVPGIKVFISCPTIRTDNLTANRKIIEVRDKLIGNGVNIISNENITSVHLGKKGLHLNNRGVVRLAMNLIACIKGF